MFKKDVYPNHRGGNILYHYTDEEGYFGIIRSKSLNPSLLEANPKDARHGDGQYLTDIVPGSLTTAQLSRLLFGVPWVRRKLAYYIAVNVQGLKVENPAEHFYLIRSRNPLKIADRIVGGGPTQ